MFIYKERGDFLDFVGEGGLNKVVFCDIENKWLYKNYSVRVGSVTFALLRRVPTRIASTIVVEYQGGVAKSSDSLPE